MASTLEEMQPQHAVAVPYELDNRDEGETWIWVGSMESKIHIRLDPWNLLSNLIENCVSDEAFQANCLKDLEKLKERVNLFVDYKTAEG